VSAGLAVILGLTVAVALVLLIDAHHPPPPPDPPPTDYGPDNDGGHW
jgi:hypothetical protein